ncbi:MAG: glycosyltransferase family 4 protein [Candidatus Kapabacteria bacterium]|nr:glycosyltransferase family 4 protein [Candidatus Kapabacteria bacterium]MCS7169731.1 glycosyltransferase family 4 protein [Candidatus Kapabacteria bacterium]MDW8225384.1 glycosyltransferase family 4 protein [Bacteroidota bacterium]
MIRLLAAVPTPPPYAGPEVGMELLLRYWHSERIQLHHLRANIRQSNAEKGRLDWRGIRMFLRVWVQYCWLLWRWRPHVVFLLLSSSRVGFLRDVLLISTARLYGAQVVGQYRGGNFAGFYRGQPRHWQCLIRSALQQLAKVLVQSRGLQAQFSGVLPAERLAVLPNGVSLADFPGRSRKVAEALPYRLLFVGHVSFAKGFREVTRAYCRLQQEMPVELWVAGTRIASPRIVQSFLPPEWSHYYAAYGVEIEAEIERFLAEAAQRDNVHILGIVSASAVKQWMAAVDLLVLPSYSEGFSMAVLEAMAAGLPVVVTPVGALGELVQDGVHGRVVPVGDADALYRALRSCLEQPDWMRQVGERNRRFVLENFAIERVVNRLEAEICAILDGVRGRG